MAAGMAKKQLSDAQIPAVVISAGTLNLNGQSAAPNAVAAAAEIDIDIASHRSQGVSLPLMSMADQLVIMAPNHEAALLALDEGLAPKIVRIWEFGQHESALVQIDDPVGQDLAAFAKCRDRLTICLKAWIDNMRTSDH